MATNLQFNIPPQQYFAMPEMNQSTAKEALRIDGNNVYVSMRAMRWAIDHKDDERTPQQVDRMNLGTAVHTCVLEPAKLPSRVTVFGGERRAGAEWKAFQGTNAGKVILTKAYYERFENIVESIQSHPQAREWLDAPGQVEAVATGVLHGVSCKARCDKLTDDPLIDLKTAATILPNRFRYQMADLGYWFQGAWYCEMFDRKRFVLIVAENTPPYEVAVFDIAGRALELGREYVREVLKQYKRAIETGEWPGAFGAYELDFHDKFYEPGNDDDTNNNEATAAVGMEEGDVF